MQRQQPQPQCRRRRAMILLIFLTLSSTIDSSYGWMTTSTSITSMHSKTAALLPTSRSASTTTTTPTTTAAFYKTSSSSSVLTTDDFQTLVTFPPPLSTIKIKRGPTINIKRESPSSSKSQHNIIGSKLPWIHNDDDSDSDNNNENDDENIYLSHWDWQLSYFKEHLTNFRINDDDDEAITMYDDGTTKNDYSDLMYIEKTIKSDSHNEEDQKQKQQQKQRVYTVSYKSDEYRDIRMTYMNFPGSAQCFRCVCYPNSSNVPIMGMAFMKFGKRNMVVMDYQPLPTCTVETNTDYELELLRIRSNIPSMKQPMSNKHFDGRSNETKEKEDERKYFTDYPLISKWTDDDDDDDAKFHRRELIRAQKDYVQTYIKLTQQEMMMRNDNDTDTDTDNDNDTDVDMILKLHSDFDTFVSSKEPAGKILCGTFGTEIGSQLIHRIIFPLSRNLLQSKN